VSLRIGDLLPDVELTGADGTAWRTAEQRGRPMVMVLHRHLA